MSDTPPPVLPPVPTPDQARSGCLTAIMVLAGIILLLPGLCALYFGQMALTAPHFDPGLLTFIVVGLLIGALGILLIWHAIRRPGA